MIGGQFRDVTGEHGDLAELHALKTGRLFAAAVGLGLRAAGVRGRRAGAVARVRRRARPPVPGRRRHPGRGRSRGAARGRTPRGRSRTRPPPRPRPPGGRPRRHVRAARARGRARRPDELARLGVDTAAAPGTIRRLTNSQGRVAARLSRTRTAVLLLDDPPSPQIPARARARARGRRRRHRRRGRCPSARRRCGARPGDGADCRRGPVVRRRSRRRASGRRASRSAPSAIPYRWGRESPTSGFDCSGLVRWAYLGVGIDLPHSSYALYGEGRRVSRARMRTGDVLFFEGLGHVGLYLGQGPNGARAADREERRDRPARPLELRAAADRRPPRRLAVARDAPRPRGRGERRPR